MDRAMVGGSSYGHSGFPPGTSPDVIRSFEMVDRDRSGFIDENELQQAIFFWLPKGIFERYDKDRSGKIDLFELRDALYSLGFAIPSSVLQVLISKYDDGSGRRIETQFRQFCRGLTEKFKEKDKRHTGITTFNYDEFMSMVIPFLVSYD
ncbi:hypothetical protein NC651_023287 [Populus alba x Populus x berolinensis]|nr:hypothetical protein NC651_023287 [Populus alba x Populus x berolinensis]